MFSERGGTWLSQIEVSDTDRMSPDVHADAIGLAARHAARTGSRVASVAGGGDRAGLLMTMPGTSCLTAVTPLSELADRGRFRTAEKFAAGGGVIPSHRNSASTYRGGGIAKQGSAWMRNAIVEAATTTARRDERMRRIYERIRRRRGAMKARVAVARHMLEIIWHMPTDNEEYRTQDRQMTQRKYKKMKDAITAS